MRALLLLSKSEVVRKYQKILTKTLLKIAGGGDASLLDPPLLVGATAQGPNLQEIAKQNKSLQLQCLGGN